MNSEKYIWLDVHQATISVAVMDCRGKLVMESILETKAATILQFFAGLRGTLSVTFEEGTWAAWLYDLLNPHVDKLVVCNGKNALLEPGNKSDRIDARKLAELLRGNQLTPVYHGETGVRMLRELSRSYLTIVKDLSRVMNRLKAVYRSWAIPCAGRDVYYRRHRGEWLAKIREAGVRRRAERLYEQLDMLQHLRQQARRELLAESRKHAITAKLRQIPYPGPIRSALAVALIQTPHRFRSKRQLWAYSGLALETRTSAEYRFVEGQVRRSKKLLCIRGLNKDHNHDLSSAVLPPGIRSRFVANINGIRMRVLEAGFETNDRPGIVLLHGFPELAYSWRKVMLPIADAGFHVIAPDRRGYGRTSGSDVRFDDNLDPS
jgi:transposase